MHKHAHAHRPHTHARPHVQLLMLRAACWVCGSRSTVGFLKSVVLCEVRDPGVWLWLVGWVSRAGGEKKGCWNDVVHVWRAFFSTAGGRECVVLPVDSFPLVWCVLAWKSWQHPKVFPGGPPPQYEPGPMPLNFGGQKRSGAFDMVWPPAIPFQRGNSTK